MCGGDPDYVEQNEFERELIDMSDRQLAHYNKLYVPLEYQQMADIDRYRSDVFRQGSMDKSVNAARMQTPAGVRAGAGVNPGTGNLMMQAIGTEQQQGTAGAMGAMAGLQSSEDLSAQGRLGLASTGRNNPAQAMQMTASIAQQQAGQVAAQKAAQQMASNAKWGALGTVGGLATGYAYDKYRPKKGKKTSTW